MDATYAGPALLVVAVAGALWRPAGTPRWLVPVAALGLALAVGLVGVRQLGTVGGELGGALAFLLLALPLARSLSEMGYFAAVADRLAARLGIGAGLWVLAAVVTAVLNLDAAVVLLTPLFLAIADRTGRDRLALASMPVVLSSVASSVLPVSNLTNLIAQAALDVPAWAFVLHLGPATVVGCTVGWFAHRRVFPVDPVPMTADTGPAVPTATATAPWLGHVCLAGLAVALVAGVPAWIAAGAALALVSVARRRLPLSAVPWSTAALGFALVALAFLAVDGLGRGWPVGWPTVPAVAAAAAAANLANNLPVVAVAIPSLPVGASCGLWSVLLGANAGPVLLLTGSLANLLWLRTLEEHDVAMTAGRFVRLGATIGLPALAASTATLLVTNLVFGCG